MDRMTDTCKNITFANFVLRAEKSSRPLAWEILNLPLIMFIQHKLDELDNQLDNELDELNKTLEHDVSAIQSS